MLTAEVGLGEAKELVVFVVACVHVVHDTGVLPVLVPAPVWGTGSVGRGAAFGAAVAVAASTLGLRVRVGIVGAVVTVRGAEGTEVLEHPGLILGFVDHGVAARLARLVVEGWVGPGCARDAAAGHVRGGRRVVPDARVARAWAGGVVAVRRDGGVVSPSVVHGVCGKRDSQGSSCWKSCNRFNGSNLAVLYTQRDLSRTVSIGEMLSQICRRGLQIGTWKDAYYVTREKAVVVERLGLELGQLRRAHFIDKPLWDLGRQKLSWSCALREASRAKLQLERQRRRSSGGVVSGDAV